MKLLIITQKVDDKDPILGFFHGWIVEFAKHCEQVTVVGLSVGAHRLPKNVRIFSLGKEHANSRLSRLWNFYRLIMYERKSYDAVFVHMNPEYVILGGMLWKILGKKIGLWYTHKAVNWRLRFATILADVIFTPSPESFRLRTPKCHVVGHGIDTARFWGTKQPSGGVFRICSIGRLSRVKDYGVLLRAARSLHNKGISVAVEIIGDAITKEDGIYVAKLKAEIFRLNLEEVVTLIGGVPNNQIESYLAKADLFVNMSKTGSLDKAVLEAMATTTPVLTSNEGLRSTLAGFENTCMFKGGDAEDFASQIERILRMSQEDRRTLGEHLRKIVERSHNLTTLIPRILALLR